MQGYFDRRMLRILLIGAISGLPWILIGTALSLWLKEEGLSRSTVGFAGFIFSVYAINFLWAPLIDKIRIPYLSARLGARKAWILLLQAIIVLALLGWMLVDPTQNLALVVGIGLVIAIASASQDITIDAMRIEQINPEETDKMAAGAAVAVIGWWTGFKIGGLIMLMVADYFQGLGYANYWQMTFWVVIAIIVAMNIGLLFVPEGPPAPSAVTEDSNQSRTSKVLLWLNEIVLAPLTSFFKNNGLKIGIAILCFVFLFKIGEAFLGRMSVIFYKEVGFSKSDIALYSKGLGWITTIVFTLIGGAVAMRFGTLKGLLFAGIAMASTNLLFALLASVGKNEFLFGTAVILDDITGAFATVAFVAFISLLVDRRYTATQYALLASIASLGRTTLASFSGVLVDGLGGNWSLFFILTALMVIPALVLLWSMRNVLKFKNEPAQTE